MQVGELLQRATALLESAVEKGPPLYNPAKSLQLGKLWQQGPTKVQSAAQ